MSGIIITIRICDTSGSTMCENGNITEADMEGAVDEIAASVCLPAVDVIMAYFPRTGFRVDISHVRYKGTMHVGKEDGHLEGEWPHQAQGV